MTRVDHTKETDEIAAAAEPSPLPTPSPTYYGQLAATLIASIDQFTAAVPDFDNSQQVSKEFVARKRNLPPQFVNDAVSALIVSPELQAIRSLNAAEVLDDKQYVDAFAPLERHLEGALKGVRFAIGIRYARLGAGAQQIYAFAKTIARDRSTTALDVHVERMKRSRTPGRRRKSDGEDVAGAKKKGGAADKTQQQQ